MIRPTAHTFCCSMEVWCANITGDFSKAQITKEQCYISRQRPKHSNLSRRFCWLLLSFHMLRRLWNSFSHEHERWKCKSSHTIQKLLQQGLLTYDAGTDQSQMVQLGVGILPKSAGISNFSSKTEWLHKPAALINYGTTNHFPQQVKVVFQKKKNCILLPSVSKSYRKFIDQI